MKIIILDGVDNTGKTSFIEKRQDKIDSILKFPSVDLKNTDEFKNSIMQPHHPTYKKDFIKKILDEEYEILKNCIDFFEDDEKQNLCIFIDRFLHSTFVYQGYDLFERHSGEHIVSDHYVNLTRELYCSHPLSSYLKFLFEQTQNKIYSFIFLKPIPENIREKQDDETNTVCQYIDRKSFKWRTLWNHYVSKNLHCGNFSYTHGDFVFKNTMDENFKLTIEMVL